MRDFAFADAPPPLLPTHKRSTIVIAVAIHALVLAVLLQVRANPVRVSPAGSPQGGIAAYVTGPISTVAPAAAPKPRPAKTALKTEAATDTASEQSTAGSAGIVEPALAAGGPVRLGAGGSITLLRKVQPLYPPMMVSARVNGQVVLDAIIHADGSIGDVTVLRSTNDVFARSAIDAVKQWKYEPIGYEAILTVTVQFTLAGHSGRSDGD
jgi:protein TonB